MAKTKIIIAGIGGVGGYFGSLLAKHFYESEQVDISFVARGEHLKQIQANGLKVIKGADEFIAKPFLATDNPSEIGIADFLIICTKSYDLETLIQQLLPSINDGTIILPLLNGVNNKEKIEKLLPNNLVLAGCVYIVSRLKQLGVIENSGNIQKLYFGLDHMKDERLQLLCNLFNAAKIEATLSTSISTTVWEKFIFLSPIATVTSAYNKSIGEVLAKPESFDDLIALIEEVKQLAEAKRIGISTDIIERTFAKIKDMPFEATSSMHADFNANKPQTELETLTHYVIIEAQQHGLQTPTYFRLFEVLKTKTSKAM